MDTSLTVRNMRRQTWAMMLREQAQSGLTIRAWCDQNGLSTKSFYYRRKQVRAMILDSAERPLFAQLTPPDTLPAAHVPAGSPDPSGFSPQLVIKVSDSVIGVSLDTPKELLSAVLEVVRGA